mmetsp:Transcript_90882/g.211465  ORF Transcript_90882/g.211465 Transcript_90882/m.211465 type:complete len:231 (-) Transcript_90882:118-810(-)
MASLLRAPAACQTISLSATGLFLLSTSAILAHSREAVQVPLPTTAPTTPAVPYDWPSANPTASASNAANTTSNTSSSPTRSPRSSRLSTGLLLLKFHAEATSKQRAEAHQGNSTVQLGSRPASAQSAMTELAKRAPPKRTKAALPVLMQTPRQHASSDTVKKTAALGTSEGAPPRWTPSRNLQSRTSATTASTMKRNPRKAMTMSGRISVRMLGFWSPTRAWCSLRQSWM